MIQQSSTKVRHTRRSCQLFLTDLFLQVRDLAYYCLI